MNRGVVRGRIGQVVLLAYCMFVVGCGASIALYNQKSYEYAVDLKVETLALIDKSTEPYTNHAQQVEALMIKIDKAYEYTKNIPKNSETAGQWEKISKRDGVLAGKYFKEWKKRGTVSSSLIPDLKKDIASAFDDVIALESAKIKVGK